MRNPGRDIPRAIFGSVFSVMGIYLLLNLAVLYVLPLNEIAGNDFALGAAAGRIFGKYGGPVIRSIMIVSILSSLNANQIFCTRTLYAMSCDGLFFSRASRVNKGGTPVLALFLSTVAGVLFLLTGTFERVIAMLRRRFSSLRIIPCRTRRSFCCASASRRWRGRIARGVTRGRRESR